MQDSHRGAERPASEPEQETEFEGLVGFCQVKGHAQRSLVGCGPWSCKELDTAEQLTHTPSP